MCSGTLNLNLIIQSMSDLRSISSVPSVQTSVMTLPLAGRYSVGRGNHTAWLEKAVRN